jgi:hypothetical protein
MKFVFALTALTFSLSSFANWTEQVSCKVERRMAEEESAVSRTSSASMRIAGPHNGENGQVVLSNPLIPSYRITYARVSSGIGESAELTVTQGRNIVSKAAIYQKSPEGGDEVVNKFISFEYEFTVRCSSKI